MATMVTLFRQVFMLVLKWVINKHEFTKHIVVFTTYTPHSITLNYDSILKKIALFWNVWFLWLLGRFDFYVSLFSSNYLILTIIYVFCIIFMLIKSYPSKKGNRWVLGM
jgi:hypothetical protein